MTDMPMSLQVAESLIDDVQSRTNQMVSYDRQHQREKLAKELLKDMSRAFGEIDKAVAQDVDVSETRARAHLIQGTIYLNVAESPEIESLFTTIIINKAMRKKYAQSFVNKWAGQALVEFNKSLQLVPTQVAHYCVGGALLLMNRKPEAQAALERAQQGDDQEIAIEAAKTIARMNEKKGFCFVATACYGSYDHPDVLVFRRWRDEVLLLSSLGRVLVGFYYRVSPPLANQVKRMPRLASAVRKFVLEPLARYLG